MNSVREAGGGGGGMAEAFLDTLRSGSDKAMDTAFRNMIHAWVPSSSCSVVISPSASSFISAPLPWTDRLGSLLNGSWTDRSVRARLATGGSLEPEEILRRVYIGTLSDNLGRLSQCPGEWSVRTQSLGWDVLRSKLRRGPSALDSSKGTEIVGWTMRPTCVRLEEPVWRLLCYTPTTARTRWWLQYAILLGLPVQWSEPYRSQIQWVLHALLPGFSHSALVDLWPWVVRCWITGLAGLVAVEPLSLPNRTLADHVLWSFRSKAQKEFGPFVSCTLDWISKRLCDSDLQSEAGWTLSPHWFHPVALQLLDRLGLHRAEPPDFHSASQAILYSLHVVVALTALGVLARHSFTDGAFGTFQIWLRQLQTQVWQKLEPPLRYRWQREFCRRRTQWTLVMPKYTAPLAHILSVL